MFRADAPPIHLNNRRTFALFTKAMRESWEEDDPSQSGSHLSPPHAQAYSSGNDGQRKAAQADQDSYP